MPSTMCSDLFINFFTTRDLPKGKEKKLAKFCSRIESRSQKNFATLGRRGVLTLKCEN